MSPAGSLGHGAGACSAQQHTRGSDGTPVSASQAPSLLQKTPSLRQEGAGLMNKQPGGERLEAEQPHSHCLATQGERVLRAQPGNGSQFAAGLHPVNGGIRGAVLFTHRAALGSAGLAPCLGFPTSGMAGGDACLPYTEQNKKSISFFFPLLTHQRRKKWFGLHLS